MRVEVLKCEADVITVASSAGRLAALLRCATLAADLDQLAAHPGALERGERLRRELRRQFDQAVVRLDVDLAEVAATQSALVGQRTHDVTGTHLVPPPDLDAVGGKG